VEQLLFLIVIQFSVASYFLVLLSPCAEEGKVPLVSACGLPVLPLRVLLSSGKVCQKNSENSYNQQVTVL